MGAGSSCCARLAANPGLNVAFPGTDAYNLTTKAYTSLQESTLSPSCIVTPQTSQEAAEIIYLLDTSKECRSEHFAFKGQGHAPAAGFANIDSGVTIDTTSLVSTSLSSDQSVVTVGVGAAWIDVYAYLDPFNLTAAGARNGAVGVGGLTLGGGISYFSPQVGFACDTVVNYEVVLSSGKLIDANATNYQDLYKALKGGTNNFGLVTSITFSTIPYNGILGGSIVQDITHRSDVFEAFANIAGAKDYDVHASVVMGLIFNSTSKAWILSNTPIYTLPEERPTVYNELFSVPNISDTLHITNLSTFANESAIPQLNWLYFTGTYGISADLLTQFFDVCNNTLYDFDVPHGVFWDLAFEPLPTEFVSHGAGTNSLGTSPSDGNSMILLISSLWPDTASNAQVHAKASELISRLNSAALSMGMQRPFRYANYADYTQAPFRSYGQTNYESLRRKARKYDPKGVFQEKVPGGFKLY